MSPAEQTYTERLEQRVRESREATQVARRSARDWKAIAALGWAAVVTLLMLGVP